MAKQQFNISADAHLAFSGPRRNGPPIVLPISRRVVAREIRFARARKLPCTRTAWGFDLGAMRFVRV